MNPDYEQLEARLEAAVQMTGNQIAGGVLLSTRSKVRRVQGHAHDDTGDESRDRHRQHPPQEDLAQLPPVERLDVAVHQGDADDGARDALGGADGQREAARQQDRDGGRQLHAEAAGGTVLGHAVAQVAHDVVAEGPEADADEQAADGLDPVRGVGLGGGFPRAPGLVLGGERPDGVGEVVGAVCDRHDHCGADLGGRPQVLDLVVVDDGAAVDVFEALGLVADDVARDAVGEDELEGREDALGVDPGKGVDLFEVALTLLVDGGGLVAGNLGLVRFVELGVLIRANLVAQLAFCGTHFLVEYSFLFVGGGALLKFVLIVVGHEGRIG